MSTASKAKSFERSYQGFIEVEMSVRNGLDNFNPGCIRTRLPTGLEIRV
jgi:hypothetical protein